MVYLQVHYFLHKKILARPWFVNEYLHYSLHKEKSGQAMVCQQVSARKGLTRPWFVNEYLHNSLHKEKSDQAMVCQ